MIHSKIQLHVLPLSKLQSVFVRSKYHFLVKSHISFKLTIPLFLL